MTERNDQKPSLSERIAESRKKIRAYLGVSTVGFLVAIVEIPSAPSGMNLFTDGNFVAPSIVGLGAAGLALREMLAKSRLVEEENASEQPFDDSSV